MTGCAPNYNVGRSCATWAVALAYLRFRALVTAWWLRNGHLFDCSHSTTDACSKTDPFRGVPSEALPKLAWLHCRCQTIAQALPVGIAGRTRLPAPIGTSCKGPAEFANKGGGASNTIPPDCFTPRVDVADRVVVAETAEVSILPHVRFLLP